MLGYGIKAETTTTGTGNLTLSSVTGFPTFSDVFALNRRFQYSIVDSDGKPIEAGVGYLSASTTLVRQLVTATYVSGTYTGANASAVSLASGTKTVVGTALQSNTFSANPYSHTKIFSGSFKGVPSQHLCNPSIGNNATQEGFLVCYPYLALHGGSINSAAVYMHSAASSGTARMRIGLWQNHTSGQPGKLIREFTANGGSPIDISSTGIKVTTMSSHIALPPGWYWVGTHVDHGGGSAGACRRFQYETLAGILPQASANQYRAASYAALGDEDGNSFSQSSTSMHTIWLGVV